MEEPDLPATGSLFRQEAIDAATTRLGAPVRPVSVAGWLLTLFLVAFIATAGIFLATAQYARKESVPGVLEPSAGSLRIVASKPGVVTRIFVADGELVHAGAPILTINLDSVTGGGKTLGKLLLAATDAQAVALTNESSARRLSAQTQRRELEAKRAGLLVHQKRLEVDLGLQAQRLSLQEQSLASFKALNEKKIVSDLQYRDRLDSVMLIRQGMSSIQREQEEATSDIAQIDAQITRIGADLKDSEAQLSNSSAELQAKRAANSIDSEVVLTAPQTGRVVALQAKLGASVATAAALAVILPQGARLEAQLWAPSKAAGFVRAGDHVRLMFDAFPYQRFGVGSGTVSAVAKAPTPPNELTVPIEAKESLYRVDVTLDRQDIDGYGKVWPLAPGMRLSADLILDRRSFLEWLFDPLLAATKRAGA